MSNDNSKKIILDLCGGTGAWSKPYKDAGYDVNIITLPKYDLLKWREYPNLIKMIHSGRVYGIFAAPTCTMFSYARTTAKTPRDFKGAMDLVTSCLSIIWECDFYNPHKLKFWALENPQGHLKRFLGNPPFSFQPFDFGDHHSKETYIWGNFRNPVKNPIKLTEKELLQSRNNTRPLPEIPKEYICDGKMKPVQIRRSITPQGFAQAFYKANK